MVNENTRRAAPEYPLPEVHATARAGAVDYGSRRVQQDIENLGYSPEDVHGCLAALTACHFRHGVQYQPGGPWADVYVVSHRMPEGPPDSIYVKLKLDRDRRLILLSFHRER